MPGKKPTEKDLEFFRTQLKLMLGVLNGDIDHLEREALGESQAAEEQGDDGGGYSVEFSLDLLERDEKTKAEVHEALERISEGDYGRCEECEIWIRKERLKAIPHARNCIDCQRAIEAQEV